MTKTTPEEAAHGLLHGFEELSESEAPLLVNGLYLGLRVGLKYPRLAEAILSELPGWIPEEGARELAEKWRLWDRQATEDGLGEPLQ
jgi:hypothetical protein